MRTAHVIANTHAGRRDAGALETLLARLSDAGFTVTCERTEYRGHAAELASGARAQGRPLVIAAGGDGTVHEVVNGFLDAPDGAGMPVLGIVAMGSGCDYARTFGIPPDLAGAVARVAADDAPIKVDVGRAIVTTPGGEKAVAFANIAEVGFGPAVVSRAARLPRAFGGGVYFGGFLIELPRFRRPVAAVHVDGALVFEGPVMNVVVAVGKAFGGGMLVAPSADPCDGLFDVQVHFGTKLDYVRGIPKVYRGRHLPHPKVLDTRARSVVVSCHGHAGVEADGEMLGTAPVRFEILPAAIRVKA